MYLSNPKTNVTEIIFPYRLLVICSWRRALFGHQVALSRAILRVIQSLANLATICFLVFPHCIVTDKSPII